MIRATWDPAAPMRRGTAQIQVATQALPQPATTLVSSGSAAEAQVPAVRDTGTRLNLQPMFELDLVVTRPGSRRSC